MDLEARLEFYHQALLEERVITVSMVTAIMIICAVLSVLYPSICTCKECITQENNTDWYTLNNNIDIIKING